MQGISQRKYAESRKARGLSGVSLAAVRKALASGRIHALPDGSIDAAVADAEWAANTSETMQRQAAPAMLPLEPPAGEERSKSDAERELTEVKLERQRLALERDKSEVIEVAEVKEVVGELITNAVGRALLAPHKIGDELAKLTDPVACQNVVEHAIREALEEISQYKVAAVATAAGLALAVYLAGLWAPPRQISTAEWANRYAVLSPETAAEPGRFHAWPFQIEPLNATSDPAIRRVVIKSSTQILKTTVIKHAIARAIDADPGPIMVLTPRQSDAKDFVDEHLTPMVRDTERLHGKIRLTKHGKAPKAFRGGRLIVTSAGSPMNVAGKPIRYLFCDEVDKYPVTAGDEGNPIQLGRKRLVSFRHRAKEIDTCSPTIAGSEIDTAYEVSDQREWFVPCPHCGAEQSLMGKFFSNVRWDDGLPTREEQAFSARYYCERCNQPWDDHERHIAVRGGRWIAKKPFNGIAGFWISELYSLQRKLWEIVLDFLQKKDKPQDYKTFVNTTLAENWMEKGDAPEWELLLARREDYPVGMVPRGGLLLTAAADVQPDRIEAEKVAWGRRGQTWSVDYQVFEGDTSRLSGPADAPSPWERLAAWIAEVTPCEGGGELDVTLCFVDSGDQTQTVYEWVRQQRKSQVVAIKGEPRWSMPVSRPVAQDVTFAGRTLPSGVQIRHVAVGFFKERLYGDLKKRPPSSDEIRRGWEWPEGYCHFPQSEPYGDEYFRQLCAEDLVTEELRSGRTRQVWRKNRSRNEALDCRVYNMAAAWLLGVPRFREHNWAALEVALGPQQRAFALSAPVAPVPTPASAHTRAPEQGPGDAGHRTGFRVAAAMPPARPRMQIRLV